MQRINFKGNRFNKMLLGLWLLALTIVIAVLFWSNEWKYSLPTPVPANYHNVKQGEFINIAYQHGIKNQRPLFLHFFNPSCPCSKFNITHFRSLVKAYNDKLNFAVVVISKDTTYTTKNIQEEFGLTIPVLFDQSIATSCGVYSTPQAVLIAADHKLYYRGNYNKSRYCADEKSNYAQHAIDSLLAQHFQPRFSEAATKSYGCQLPNCTK